MRHPIRVRHQPRRTSGSRPINDTFAEESHEMPGALGVAHQTEESVGCHSARRVRPAKFPPSLDEARLLYPLPRGPRIIAERQQSRPLSRTRSRRIRLDPERESHEPYSAFLREVLPLH